MDIRFNLLKPIKRRHASQKASPHKISSIPAGDCLSQTVKHHHSARQEKGFSYEQMALDFLLAQNLVLLAQNLSCRMGEIDLVMQDGQTLVFVEVRYRHSHQFGGAIASITPTKYRKLQRTAYYFLPSLTQRFFCGITPPCRFDAVCIHGDSTEKLWLKNITY